MARYPIPRTEYEAERFLWHAIFHVYEELDPDGHAILNLAISELQDSKVSKAAD